MISKERNPQKLRGNQRLKEKDADRGERTRFRLEEILRDEEAERERDIEIEGDRKLEREAVREKRDRRRA